MPGPATTWLRQTSKRVKDSPNPIAAAVAKVVATEVRTQLKMDGARLAGRRLSVSVKVLGNAAVISAAPRKSIGAWTILDSGTKAHNIAAKRTRESRAMSIGGAWRTGPWRVSGVAGKHTWSKGVDRARPKVADAGRQELAKAVTNG